jgi:hypothetical protein
MVDDKNVGEDMINGPSLSNSYFIYKHRTAIYHIYRVVFFSIFESVKVFLFIILLYVLKMRRFYRKIQITPFDKRST